MVRPVPNHSLSAALALILTTMSSSSPHALEAVAQGDVGAGSTVAGSIGAVQARADALQANQTASNMLVNQMQQEVKDLREQVTKTQLLVQQLQGGGGAVTQTIQKITECNARGQFWNGSTCVAVNTNFRLACRTVRADSSGSGLWSIAACGDGETLTGGGGAAEVPASDICAGTSAGFLHTSQPSGNGWIVDGYQHGWLGEVCTRAYAICCKVVSQ